MRHYSLPLFHPLLITQFSRRINYQSVWRERVVAHSAPRPARCGVRKPRMTLDRGRARDLRSSLRYRVINASCVVSEMTRFCGAPPMRKCESQQRMMGSELMSETSPRFREIVYVHYWEKERERKMTEMKELIGCQGNGGRRHFFKISGLFTAQDLCDTGRGESCNQATHFLICAAHKILSMSMGLFQKQLARMHVYFRQVCFLNFITSLSRV